MRSGILTLGIVLLIIGIASYMTAQIKLQEYQSLLGQAALILSQQAKQNYQMFQLMQMGGAVLGAVGLIVSIAGIAAKEE